MLGQNGNWLAGMNHSSIISGSFMSNVGRGGGFQGGTVSPENVFIPPSVVLCSFRYAGGFLQQGYESNSRIDSLSFGRCVDVVAAN